MLYSEFIDRVGRVRTVEQYHKEVEPLYYNFDGDKNRFCLKFIGQELHRVNDKYLESREYLEKALVANDETQIEVWKENTKMWDEIWHDLMEHRQALIKRIYG